ncbi:DUF1642 domain-containing protein [Enterococcus faecalis]|nr:DUF1642 domain-containing protein [Enterococcus faecalis]
MNKQELIETLEEIRANIDRDIEIGDRTVFSRGEKNAYNNAIGLAKQLDEPEKVVVPKFVAYFIEDGNHYDKIAFLVHQKYLGINSLMRECPVKDWLMSVDYKTVLSLVNGYEVEKEQLYYVDFMNDGDVHKRLILDHENGKYNTVDWSDNLIGLVQEMFTEQEIKAIDERYWLFAVKVDGE